MKPLRRLVFTSIFSECGIFQRSTLCTFSMEPWEIWSFIDIFWMWNFSEVHTYYILHETPWEFGLSSIFSKCGIFQRSILGTFRKNLEKFDLSSIFSMCGIFQRSTLNTFSMKLLRSSDFHRCFLNVDFFRSSHLVYFDETFEKFDLSSIFSKSGIFQRSILSTFRCNPWKVWSFINIFF